MFDSRKKVSGRMADTADLVIDFATLGEYGLEPVDGSVRRPCEARHRPASRRSTGTWSAAVTRFSTPS